MKYGMQKKWIALLRAAASISTLFTATTLFAAPAAWDGGGGADHSWQNALNWNPNGLTIELANSVLAQANSISISTLNPFTVHNNGFSMSLTSGSLTRADLAGTEGNQALDVFISLGANATWNVNGAGQLTVGGLFNSSPTARS